MERGRTGSSVACEQSGVVLKSRPMCRLLLGFLLCAMSVAFGMARSVPQDTTAPPNPKQHEALVSPEAVQGCYELALSPWFPEMKLGEDEEFITPPPRIQLFAEKGTEGWEGNGYIVRPAPGVKPSIHRGAYWLPKGRKSLEIVFTTGFSGLMMGLKTADAETLRGRATTFWDFDRKKQTAEVTARRVPCGKR